MFKKLQFKRGKMTSVVCWHYSFDRLVCLLGVVMIDVVNFRGSVCVEKVMVSLHFTHFVKHRTKECGDLGSVPLGNAVLWALCCGNWSTQCNLSHNLIIAVHRDIHIQDGPN